jgi:hypothetical protein
MTPFGFLLLAAGVTGLAVFIDQVKRRRRRTDLAELARQWRMHYVERDVFELSRRLLPRFVVPGAALVRVTDLIYGVEGEFHRYIFSTEYTVGAVRVRKRLVRVATVREPRRHTQADNPPQLEHSDPDLSLVEQYKALYTRIGAPETLPVETSEDGARE